MLLLSCEKIKQNRKERMLVGIDSVVVVAMNSVYQLLHAGYEGPLRIINVFVVFLGDQESWLETWVGYENQS